MFDRRFGLCLAFAVCACGSSSPTSSSSTGSTEPAGLSAQEMQAAIQGVWTGTFTDVPGTLTITVNYVPPAKTTACGTHIASHPLCIDVTQSSVKATIQSTDTRIDGRTASGQYESYGMATQGRLSLDLGGGTTLWASYVTDDLEGSFSINGAAGAAFTMKRTP